jgi:hypothetical protein
LLLLLKFYDICYKTDKSVETFCSGARAAVKNVIFEHCCTTYILAAILTPQSFSKIKFTELKKAFAPNKKLSKKLL